MNEKNKTLYNQPQDDLRQIWFGIRERCVQNYTKIQRRRRDGKSGKQTHSV